MSNIYVKLSMYEIDTTGKLGISIPNRFIDEFPVLHRDKIIKRIAQKLIPEDWHEEIHKLYKAEKDLVRQRTELYNKMKNSFLDLQHGNVSIKYTLDELVQEYPEEFI